ncbi:MAG: rRNA pseudouridine synthase [Bacteroidia bacterium]|nr:rRNA pseudouridine synthase [Bacteroidia bacterium]
MGEERGGREESRYRTPKAGNFSKSPRKSSPKTTQSEQDSGEGIRLNKYIANSGISSRRDADKFIKTGVVTVNGKVVTEMGYRVAEGDIVKFGDRSIRPEKPVYVVLNKPKDFITTTDDPRGRNIVTNLIKIKERVFPVGRLDRNTTGVLILTNDGDLGERLMHPRFNITKIYLAVLDKNLKPEHAQQLKEGVELEDGIIAFDDIAYVADDKKTIGVQIHSGRNRIIHRTFEHLGYKVDKLDRTSYAGITKKDLKRGDWRYLTPLELIELKKLTKLKGKY